MKSWDGNVHSLLKAGTQKLRHLPQAPARESDLESLPSQERRQIVAANE